MNNIYNRLNGHSSNKLLNDELHAIYEIFKYINYPEKPSIASEGMFWRDNNNLQYYDGEKWVSFFDSEISDQVLYLSKLFNDITSPTPPLNPTVGQLWNDNGTLKYYDGDSFVATRTNVDANKLGEFDFYNYLAIPKLLPSGENFSNSLATISQYAIDIDEVNWIKSNTDDIVMYKFTIPHEVHGLKEFSSYTIVHQTYDGNGSYLTEQLDNSEYQFLVNTENDITVYINSPIKCSIRVLGVVNYENSNHSGTISYLIPDASADRIFIDGKEFNDYKYLNNISISVDSNIITDKTVSLIHTSPQYLNNINTYLFVVTPSSPTITIPKIKGDRFAEYYIYDPSSDQFIMMHNDNEIHYTILSDGIKLTDNTINSMQNDEGDIIVIVATFDFYANTIEGSMIKTFGTITDVNDNIDLSQYDDSIIYLDGHISLPKNSLSSSAFFDNEIILGSDGLYYIYDKDTGNTKIVSEKTSSILDSYFSQLSVSDDKLTINKNCDYSIYSYNYSNSVEHPITVGYVDTSSAPDDSGFTTSLSKTQYLHRKNTLSVYINGVRQYPDSQSITESETQFSVVANQNDSIMYVVEPLEAEESVSCEYEILNTQLSGQPNTYQTNILLTHSFLRVFKNGIRIPCGEYDVLAPHVIHINDTKKSDVILIETRKDHALREITVPINGEQTSWTVGDSEPQYNGIAYDGIPLEMLMSRDTIMIFINGIAFYNTNEKQNYTIDYDSKSIILNEAIEDLLDNDSNNGYITFEWR